MDLTPRPAVQETLAEFAKLSADLRQECERSVQLRRQSQELRSEAAAYDAFSSSLALLLCQA
jgi:hypothetical protein